MLKGIGTLWKSIWIVFCALAGALIGAALLGLQFDSGTLAIVGAVVGLGLGAVFGRFISVSDVLG